MHAPRAASLEATRYKSTFIQAVLCLLCLTFQRQLVYNIDHEYGVIDSTIADMSSRYEDRLANFHCFDKIHIFLLTNEHASNNNGK